MTALIIEDNADQANRIARRLTHEGYACTLAADGPTGLSHLASGRYGVAIVDIMLPKMSGLEVIRQAREDGVKTPVVILSARSERSDRISGLNLGADYYLQKPYSGDELLAALKAVLRRQDPKSARAKMTFADIELDPEREAVTRNGREIPLPPHEFKLLKYLMENPGLIVTPETIIRRVWHYNCIPTTNIVSPRVYALRQRLSEFGGRNVIFCERRLGYVLR